MTTPLLQNEILSTYRIQFHRDFPFAAGAALAGYLAKLGITHVYASPILRAREGSVHGYDVVSYDEINPDLGGNDGFRQMAAALKTHGIGLILDIVPNHVAVGGDANAMWLDLLKHGRHSRYADWFDVDFETADPYLQGKVHAPFLGSTVGQALAGRKLTLVEDAPRGGFALRYGEHLFPIRRQDDEEIRRRGLATFDDPQSLSDLADRQNYRLDYWRNASDRLNWRRFFEVTELAGIRMENPDAFEAAHRIAFALYREGLIDGFRIDHVDGLADPAAYCTKVRRRLRELQPGLRPGWLLVEKILAPKESLPASWKVDGTTGYDFMDHVSALQHASDGEMALSQHWALVSGRSPSFKDEEYAARWEVLEKSFGGQREQLVDRLLSIATATGRAADLPRGAVRRALTAVLSNMRAYRTYATGATALEHCGAFFIEAVKQARLEPLADTIALDFVEGVMSGELASGMPSRVEAIRRFNQLSSPLAARAVEDTTFYRYGRLLSRNDVGFDAATLSMPSSRFHELMTQRVATMPSSILALATHDHKRGADVRARLAVVSEIPNEWQAVATTWFALNGHVRPVGLDAGDEYMFYQMLTGSWPLDTGPTHSDADYADRMVAWWLKGLREAKLRSNWSGPNEAYEAKAEEFARAVLDRGRSPDFLSSIEAFVDRIGPAGAVNGLTQLILQCTAPGIPDTYQGTELWDFSGVDPDNRRPVDFHQREQALVFSPWDTLCASWRDGRIKQQLLCQLLRLRRENPGLFANSDYSGLTVTGARRDNVIAYSRSSADRILVCVLPIRPIAALVAGSLQTIAHWWGDTAVVLPVCKMGWSSPFGQPNVTTRLTIGEAFGSLPFWIGMAN